MTAYGVAQRHAVSGFVRNLPDGTVELLAEGEPAQVESCLADLQSAMGAYIQNTEVREKRPGRRTGFQILH